MAQVPRSMHGATTAPLGASVRARRACLTPCPTKDGELRTLPLDTIKKHVDKFIAYATRNDSLKFFVTAIGTGLAGYTHEEMASLFAGAPANCKLPDEWAPYIKVKKRR
jgi:hypothetical protein